MSYIVIVRMPGGALVPIMDGDEGMQEFGSQIEAIEFAESSTVCMSFEYEIVSLDI